MRIFKYAVIVLFSILFVVYTWNWYQDKTNEDNSGPIIQLGSKQIDVSVKSEDSELIKDVIATDEKDGDITSKIVVESISKFIDKKEHICNITYAVADSDNHVVKATRRIHFTDYRSPRFVLRQPLSFNTGSDIGVEEVIGAEDVYDGDISSKVKILSRTVSTNVSGDNTVTAQVTNSLGDTVKLKAMVNISQENNLSPKIHLKENIIYLKKGDKFNASDYVASAEDNNGKKISTGDVKVTGSSVSTKKAGCYFVEYTVTDGDDNKGTAYLTVVVEE